jgi:DNA repair protein RecN (Recombination protein N)
MLEELRIQNFAIIEALELEFAPGFNVITGETGAGKSIIIDAVEMILGGRADVTMVRAGAEKAVIEAVFRLHKRAREMIRPYLEEDDLLEPDAGFITLSRDIRSNGRTSARINGVTVGNDLLRMVGETLVDIHGQSEHMSLLRSRHHIDLLDRYADLLEIREALETVVDHLAEVRREKGTLMADQDALERRAEQLRYAVEEIDAARLRPGEDDELKAERNRLANSEQLATLTAEAATLLSGDDRTDTAGAVDQLQRAALLLGKLAAIDPDLNEIVDLADTLSAQAQDLSIEIARYGQEVEYDPDRLNEIEERLELINRLRRRYGATIDAVIQYAENARRELDGLENSEERLEELAGEEDKLLRQIGEIGQNISKVRARIGAQLSKRVVNELKDLRMERAQFEVSLGWRDDADGCYVVDNGVERRVAFDSTGIDDVEFMMSANAGEPLRPLAKVASGGEAARIMLSLKRVLSQADHTPTLIFDEVDQGIGGRVGGVVGEKLWSLTGSHQVLVVTHLPQLAGFADRHFHVRKVVIKDRTATQVVALDAEPDRITELADMLGATGEGGQQSAREILAEARTRKASAPATETQEQQKLL